MSVVEATFECSGFCTTNLFYFDQPISKGRPDGVSCTNKEQQIVDRAIAMVGIASLISGLILSCLFCWQYCLWKKYEDNSTTLIITTTKIQKFDEED